jgi:hypothetical protein
VRSAIRSIIGSAPAAAALSLLVIWNCIAWLLNVPGIKPNLSRRPQQPLVGLFAADGGPIPRLRVVRSSHRRWLKSVPPRSGPFRTSPARRHRVRRGVAVPGVRSLWLRPWKTISVKGSMSSRHQKSLQRTLPRWKQTLIRTLRATDKVVAVVAGGGGEVAIPISNLVLALRISINTRTRIPRGVVEAAALGEASVIARGVRCRLAVASHSA